MISYDRHTVYFLLFVNIYIHMKKAVEELLLF